MQTRRLPEEVLSTRETLAILVGWAFCIVVMPTLSIVASLVITPLYLGDWVMRGAYNGESWPLVTMVVIGLIVAVIPLGIAWLVRYGILWYIDKRTDDSDPWEPTFDLIIHD
jgi:hypothetical protein